MQIRRFVNDYSLPIGIIVTGLILRLIFIGTQGLSNDELSAWNRLHFESFSVFLDQGVREGDMHPAFYQVFLLGWTKMFGESEWALRSTGILFYLLNSLLILRVSKRYFSEASGILILGLYAALGYTIMNTVFARPYNSGTFFLLLSLLQILQLRTAKRPWWNVVLLALSLSGAMLSHYFAFLVAGILGVCGLLYLGKRWYFLVLAGVLAMLMFLPHLSITLFHLSRGGLGWLPKPGLDWSLNFLFQLFNDSWFLVALWSSGLVLLFIRSEKSTLSRESVFVLTVGVVSFVTGFVISYLYTPVLRDLVMLFILPFLLMPLCGKVRTEQRALTAVIVLLISVTAAHSVLAYKVYQPIHYGLFREHAERIDHVIEEHQYSKVVCASNYNNVNYLNYYLQHDQQEPIVNWDDPESLYKLSERARISDGDIFIYSFSSAFHTPMFLEVIRRYFPVVQESKYYPFSFVQVMKKGKRHLEQPFRVFGTDSLVIAEDEFLLTDGFQRKEIPALKSRWDYILVTCFGELTDSVPLHFIVTAEREGKMIMKDSVPLVYAGYDQSRLAETGKETLFTLAFDLPEGLKGSDMIKCYFWNPQRGRIKTSKLKYYVVREGR